MDQKRQQKIEHACLRIIANFIRELGELQSDFGLISVFECNISKDFSYMDIQVWCQKNQELLPKKLASYAKELEAMITRELSLRKAPRIRFRLDDSYENGSRIQTLIHSVV